ncbi:MAG: CDP-diacylglycerol--glycerol-3-phosphate 3-phosphatidyltransferase [Leptolyngbyaceae bacterium]|nr:CDP-diacylglycerol--glycerol-3-phosphate 3-phosphatidyltransferase [Leptolyngbyaceae bacterium]
MSRWVDPQRSEQLSNQGQVMQTANSLLNLPNSITLSRLLGIPVILYWLHDPSMVHRWWSLGVFILVAATDWLDGYLARRLHQVTEIGKFLDPLVDKLLVLIVLLALIEMGSVPGWGVGLILARELAIAGWRVNQPTVSGANLWGKLKTVSQIVAIALLIAPLPPMGQTLAIATFWLAVGLTIISGLIYVGGDRAAAADPGIPSISPKDE